MANSKNFLGINWKVRAKKKSFWVAIVSAVLAFAIQIASIFGYDVVNVATELETAINLGLGILVLMGIIEDPVTEGIKDSERAQGYDSPKDSTIKGG